MYRFTMHVYYLMANKVYFLLSSCMNYENYRRNVHILLIIHPMCFQRLLKPTHNNYVKM